MTVNYSVTVSCSAHSPPGGRNSGSTTDHVIADSRYRESRYSEVRLYLVVFANTLKYIPNIKYKYIHFCEFQVRYKYTTFLYSNMYLNRTLVNILFVFTVDWPSRVEITYHNFPESLKRHFLSQAEEIARKCVQPPLKKKPK